jgi:hypothetical protein
MFVVTCHAQAMLRWMVVCLGMADCETAPISLLSRAQCIVYVYSDEGSRYVVGMGNMDEDE